MPPIPIYTSSPINASKPSGVTPETAPPARAVDPSRPQPVTATPTGTTGHAYPPAQPGAVPHAPAPTGTAQLPRYVPVQPTPTTHTEDQGPPAPQPGAVPQPPGGSLSRTNLPPPPRAGERFQPPTQTAAPQFPGASMPSQMNIPAPTMPYAQRGTATATGPSYGQGGTNDHFDHPPGYHQNTDAANMPGYARPSPPTHSSYEAGPAPRGLGNGEDDDGVWDAARKFVQTAGQKLSEAETEVWRRINKN